jgi:hypothetical protein
LYFDRGSCQSSIFLTMSGSKGTSKVADHVYLTVREFTMPPYLQLGQDGFSTRDSDSAWVGLVLCINDLAILVNDHGPATVAIAHTSSPTVVLREQGLGITEEKLCSIELASCHRKGQLDGKYNVVTLDSVDLAPCVHDPAVVGCNHGDDINSLALELVDLLDVWWEMESLAARCEGACLSIVIRGTKLFIHQSYSPGTLTMTTFLPAHSLLALYS